MTRRRDVGDVGDDRRRPRRRRARTISSASLTVHTFTASPRSCARATTVGRDVAGEQRRRSGWSAAWPCSAATSSAVERVDAEREQAGRDVGRRARAPGRRSRGRTTRRAPSSRRRATRAARRRASARPVGRVEVGVAGRFLISTFTSMPAQTSSTSASVGTSGRAAADLGERSARRAARAGASASWWTTSTPSARAVHVELHAVGAELQRPARTPRGCSRAPAGWRPGGRGRAVTPTDAYGERRASTHARRAKSWSGPCAGHQRRQ